MKKIFTLGLILLSLVSFGQSETHDFITLDSSYYAGFGTQYFTFRARYPADYFTAGNADTATRPCLMFMPGQGETGNGLNTPSLFTGNGPEYWLAHGWDGGITISNGKHYPIIITVISDYVNPRGPQWEPFIRFLKARFHLKDIHVIGFSMGGFTWGKLIVYEASAGAETGMKLLRSFTSLQGASTESFAPYNAWSRGAGAYGRWAKIYGGRFFALEGTGDTRNLWDPRDRMNDSVPGSAYFSYENEGGGEHCCWNSMQDVNRTNFTNTTGNFGPYISSSGLHPNSMGTYRTGDNLYTWAFRQSSDTALKGASSGSSGPVANAGADQTITATQVTLAGSSSGTVTGRTWARVSGPNTPGSSGTTTATSIWGATGTALIPGTYIFSYTVTDGTTPNTDNVTVTVTTPGNDTPTVSAGPDQTIFFPTGVVTMAGTASDADGTVTIKWTQVSGPDVASITDDESLTTQITGLNPGVYIFRNTATDDDAATAQDDVAITVVNPTSSVAKNANVNIYGGANPFGATSWNDWNVTASTTISNIKYTDGTSSGYSATISSAGTIADNGASYGGGVAPAQVLRYTSYSTSNRSITLSGLDNEKSYNLKVFASRAGANLNTIVSVGSQPSYTVAVSNNKTDYALFSGLTTDNGTITVNLSKGSANYNYINGFTLEEAGSEVEDNAPVVTPIAGQTITLPTSTGNLSAEVQDEGGDLFYRWSLSSGTGTYTIVNDSILTTTVTGLTAGTYVFQLSVTDTSGNVGTANITIVVNPSGSTPPVVSAGSDQSLTLGTGSTTISATLTGTATTSGTITARLWEHISGPAGWAITSPTSAQTTVTGLGAGGSVFKFTATDNNGVSTSDTMQISVSAAQINTQKFIMGLGEYQNAWADSTGTAYSLGNITNRGNSSASEGIPSLVQVPTGVKFKALAGGLHGAGGIDRDGNVWIWGDNDQGQHGQGDLTSTLLPRKILIDSTGNPFNNVTKLVAFFTTGMGGNGWYAVKEDGTLWVWGRPFGGMRANGTDSLYSDTFSLRPVQIMTEKPVKEIAAGGILVVLYTDGTVATCGPLKSSLGYTSSNTKDYQSLHTLTQLSGIDHVYGGRLFNYATTAAGALYGWGFNGNNMGDLTNPTGAGANYTTPRALPNITNNLLAKIVKIAVNYVATHALLEDGSLYGWGDNTQGGVGNGVTTDWSNYPTPYAVNGENVIWQKLPVRIAPGILFSDVFFGNTYCKYTYALATDGKLYGWGRGKGGIFMDGIIAANTNIAAGFTNAFDLKWPKLMNPNVSTTYPATSPSCVDGTSTGSPCNTYSIPANTKPTANAGSNQTITRNFTDLNGSASSDNLFIYNYEWKFVSGPNTPVIDLPASITPHVTGMVDGVYVFRLTVEDNGRLKDSTTMTVTVSQNGNQPPVITAFQPVEIVLPVSTVQIAGVATDPEGGVIAYSWTRVSGPGIPILENTTSPVVTIYNLSQGEHVFQLRVLDSQGVPATATVQVTVKPAGSFIKVLRIKLN